MIGIGVIGTGIGASLHVPAFLAVHGAFIAGIASRNLHRTQEIARTFSIPRAFGDWRDLVRSPEVDAVCITSPPGAHEEMAREAVIAGKAVLCEKPLALNLSQATRMAALARTVPQPHMVNFLFREFPPWQYAKARISEGDLGPLRHVSVTWTVQSWSDPNRPWSWRADRSQGGGVLSALGVHVFDYLEWLLGPVRSLSASLTVRIPFRPDLSGAPRPVTSEDCCHLMMTMADGTPVQAALSNVAPLGRGHWVEFYGDRQTLILGSSDLRDYAKGFYLWTGRAGSERLQEWHPADLPSDGGELPDGRSTPMRKLAQRFVEAVREGNLDVRPSFEDGYRAQRLREAALRSDRERRWVELSDFSPIEEPCL